jgi:hypothetical protein
VSDRVAVFFFMVFTFLPNQHRPVLKLMQLILYRWDFVPTNDEMDFVRQKFGDSFRVPENFSQTVVPFVLNNRNSSYRNSYSYSDQPPAQINSQTTAFCDRLSVVDPMALLLHSSKESSFDLNQVRNT